jgi:hypothetical protein
VALGSTMVSLSESCVRSMTLLDEPEANLLTDFLELLFTRLVVGKGGELMVRSVMRLGPGVRRTQ